MAFWRSYAHIVWSTKYREPLIRPETEGQLYACLVDKAAELDCCIHAVGGVADHIHLVISIPPKHSVAWVVKNLKGSSSHLMNHGAFAGSQHFAWQRGYGYLTLGEKQCEAAVAYVLNQKQHHQNGMTNSWLEKTNDEEGEVSDSGVTAIKPRTLREPSLSYVVEDDLPF